MSGGVQRINILAKHVLTANIVSSKSNSDEVAQYDEGQHFGLFADYEQPIHLAKKGMFSKEGCPPRCFPHLLADAAKKFPKDVALAAEKPVPQPQSPGVAPALPWDQWKKWTWSQYYEDSRRAAKAFIVLGVTQFGAVSIFGFNAPEWMISAFGAMLCGGKYVGIYSTDTPEQLAYKVSHSGSGVIVVDSQVEYDAAACKIDDMPHVRALVVWGIAPPVGDLKRNDGSVVRVFSWDALLQFGAKEGSDLDLDARMAAQKPGHCVGLIYTSGTTGNPKAVMISHDNVFAQGAMMFRPELGIQRAWEEGQSRILSYLPLSHIAGGLMDILNPVYAAGAENKKSCIYFARPYDLKEMTLASRIQFVRPTAFLAVPRVYEKIQARMMAVGASITGLKKSIATWAKAKGLAYARNLQLGGSQAAPMFHGLADKLILSKARDALGLDKCRVFITGAAPISVETLEYFGQLGMMIQNVYGMSESGGLTTICSPGRNVFGTVGHSLPGIEVKCFQTGSNGENIEVPPCKPGQKNLSEKEQGELCYRGRHIMMGYLANKDFGEEHVKEMLDKNKSSIDKWGWLRSGDKGCIDTNGMTRITGRYKELIIGAGGENIAPVPVEEYIKQLCPAISNVMMVGDNKKYNVALITLQAEGATGEFPGGDELTLVGKGVGKAKTISEAIKDPVWHAYIQGAIDKTNSNPTVCQSNAWKVQKWTILPRDFSIQTGEFTATLKLKRSVAEETWQKEINALYKE